MKDMVELTRLFLNETPDSDDLELLNELIWLEGAKQFFREGPKPMRESFLSLPHVFVLHGAEHAKKQVLPIYDFMT